MKNKVIIDGDWGGDEMQLAAVLLAEDNFNVIGATACFGNVNQDQVFENARNILSFLNASHIPVYQGAKCPRDKAFVEEDGAHGGNGIGNVKLEQSKAPYETNNAVDFILDQLRSNPPKTVSITASGPLTNIAMAFEKDPETMMKVKDIVVMGGAVIDMKAADMPKRRGNITKNAEFNFYSAPKDADYVLNSGLPITLLPMNCTHQMTLTPERQQALRNSLAFDKSSQEKILDMMCAPSDLDRKKFNLDPTMHDVHCALYLLNKDLYSTFSGKVKVSNEAGEERGKSDFYPSGNGKSSLRVAMRVKNSNACFDIFLKSITKRLSLGRNRLILLQNKLVSQR